MGRRSGRFNTHCVPILRYRKQNRFVVVLFVNVVVVIVVVVCKLEENDAEITYTKQIIAHRVTFSSCLQENENDIKMHL